MKLYYHGGDEYEDMHNIPVYWVTDSKAMALDYACSKDNPMVYKVYINDKKLNYRNCAAHYDRYYKNAYCLGLYDTYPIVKIDKMSEDEMSEIEMLLELKHIIKESIMKELTAYHGTDYDFNKFSTRFKKSGEGSNVYGSGIYVTNVREIGEYYAGVVTEKNNHGDVWKYVGDRTQYKPYIYNDAEDRMNKYNGDKKKTVDNLVFSVGLGNDSDFVYQVIKNSSDKDWKRIGGILYVVDIPDDNGSNYLDLSLEGLENVKPFIDMFLDAYYSKVCNMLKKTDIKMWNSDNDDNFYKNHYGTLERMIKQHQPSIYDIKRELTTRYLRTLIDKLFETLGESNVKKVLMNNGYIGFKVPAGYILHQYSGNGTNYIIWNPKNIKIIKKQYL